MEIRIILLVSAAVFGVSSAFSIPPPDRTLDISDPVKKGSSAGLYDGIDLSTLTRRQLVRLADAEDEILKGYFDIHAYTNGVAKSRRAKRWFAVARAAFTAGRTLFKSFSRGRVTTSGARLTRQYNKPGNYGDAVRDFRRLNPSGVKPIGNKKVQGMTGKLGKHKITVRNSSSNGRPTLEIRSPKNGAETVRKFRYNKE